MIVNYGGKNLNSHVYKKRGRKEKKRKKKKGKQKVEGNVGVG